MPSLLLLLLASASGWCVPPGGPPSAGGPGRPGPGPVTFTFNNGGAVAYTGDGEVHVVHVENGAAVYRRGGGDTLVAAPSPFRGAVTSVAIAGDGHAALGLTWTSGHPGTVYASLSTDAGRTWSAPAALTPPGANGVQPNLRVWTGGGASRAVVVWHEGVRGGPTVVREASWEGRAWLPAQTVSTGTTESAFPSVGGAGDWTEIVWRDDRRGAHELYAAERTGPTGPFTNEHPLGIPGFDPSVCVTAAGRVHVAFQDRGALLTARSEDRGATFATPVQLDPTGLFGHVSCDGADRVAVVWEDLEVRGDIRDDTHKHVGFAVSADGGRTFTAVPLVGATTQQVMPAAGLAPDGTVDVVWVDKPAATPRRARWHAW